MTSTAQQTMAPLQPAEFAFSDADFSQIASLALKKYGLNLQSSKKALVYSRLAKRLRQLKMSTFADYYALLNQPQEHDEHSHFLSALTTNVTHFFREEHHFTYLQNIVMPKLVTKAQAGRSVRLWSSACSSGQEAYCMAAIVNAVCPEFASLDIKILATDIDPKIVAQAKQGTYPDTQRTAIPAAFRDTMIAANATSDGSITMHRKLKSLISFAELNLIGAWPMRKEFDVIFCRNVAIYFDPATQHRLWTRFHDLLAPDGHMMIGHSERLGGQAAKKFHNVDITTYQKSIGHAPFLDEKKE
ncbi:chemotaxis protein [Loktanella sp. D2R18]|uniref:CheR family methyltransferase n=1 Tax=Rhodobacterales TaxID=204455 RepID=UPI000DEBF192|nr:MULTISPECIES: protein-glutamate O-methyltransferase CheR [Rhodobacterales]MDO6590190.1 protein-glutamate O-methyltransferase CheR [Yoonia sp. 1_MG-2023]RBW42982.1 chemotaxis protein [Loktanella sp. D2R18]